MRYQQFGSTGLFVSELCLGTMTFGGGDSGIWGQIGRLQQVDVDGLMRRALDAGINLIDMADVYSEGQSERLTGQALRNLGVSRDDVVVAEPGVEARLENLDVLAGNLRPSQAPDELLALAAEHAADDDFDPALTGLAHHIHGRSADR